VYILCVHVADVRGDFVEHCISPIYACTHIINAFPHVADMRGDSLLVDYLKCCETKFTAVG
jgi:hypothetical protein